jgi:hypothetical protein
MPDHGPSQEPAAERNTTPDPPRDHDQPVGRLADQTALGLFQIGESRRSAVDQMMWQVPALSLTAQAFLLQIAYGDRSRWISRLVMASLGIVTALAAIQLLLKHRYHEETRSLWLERFAEQRRWPLLHSQRAETAFAYSDGEHPWGTHARSGLALSRVPEPLEEQESAPRLLLRRVRWRMVRRSSPYVWIATLSVFAFADLVVVGGWIDHLLSGANPFG